MIHAATPLRLVIDQQRQIGPYEETKWSLEREKNVTSDSSAAIIMINPSISGGRTKFAILISLAHRVPCSSDSFQISIMQ